MTLHNDCALRWTLGIFELKLEPRMAVFSAMMVGTVAGVAVLGTTIVSLAR